MSRGFKMCKTTYVDCDQAGHIVGQFTAHQQVANQFASMFTLFTRRFEEELSETGTIDGYFGEMCAHSQILDACIDFGLHLTSHRIDAVWCHIEPFLWNIALFDIT